MKEDRGQCIWYGQCYHVDRGYFWDATIERNCFNNTKAIPLDPKGYKLLLKHCPDFFSDSNKEKRTCCDYNQLKTFDQEVNKLQLGNTCLGCVKNIKAHLCQVTCSPRQSDFIKVTGTASRGGKISCVIIIFGWNAFIPKTLSSRQKNR